MRLFYFLISVAFFSFSGSAQDLNSYFQPLKYRNIGPFRGGRSVTATGVVSDPLTYYMGTTGGGLWKTTNAGQRWQNISDGFFKTGSVGAVAVSESNPNVIYCGMGEHAIRGVMTSYGDGVYKSTDAGKTWKKIGLDKTAQISRIVISPTNPDVVYVAAQGVYQTPTPERGVYRSKDGGTTWDKVLFVNESTGASELSMDMQNPSVLYAAMWDYQRTPWEMRSGGPGSGLYKSSDGGTTWDTIHKGLPKEMGKMAISVSRANPNTVFALIESDSQQDKGGLFVSKNAGKSWEMASGDNRLTQRAWYYTELFTDPSDENLVYVMSASALRSIDGGKTWETLSGTHGDYHDLWINPKNSKNMVIANDGGAAVSFDRGATWSSQDNMPTGQFYRINTDNLFPYNVYGGQQDNTSVKITELSLGRSGIGEQDWTYAAGGESAFLAFDPEDPRYVYGGSYLGTIEVLDMKSKASTNIMAAPIQYLGRAARDMKYLFNWNAPIIMSKHKPGTIYHGAQLVLKTTDQGQTWAEISPDLTRDQDDKQGKGGGPYRVEAVGAENYGTLSYIAESPHEPGVLYTGSDDGYVYLTKNDGESWKNITPKGLKECLINAIEVSPSDPATAYIATTRYKFNDYTPAIYKTTDYGNSWENISAGIPYGAFTRVVREDPVKKNLLYAGTETGMYISWDSGKSWKPFQLNLPITPITDLMVHDGDLVVATSGRAFWILDDLTLLEDYTGKTSGLALYQPDPAVYGNWSSPLNGNDADFTGSDDFDGVNPANGVVFYYNLPKLADSIPVTLTVKDQNGTIINSFSSKADATYQNYEGAPPKTPTLSKNEGLNRFVWNTHYPTIPGVPEVYIEASYSGHKAAPGEYSIILKANGKTIITTAVIKVNPVYGISAAQYAEYDGQMTEMEKILTQMHQEVNTLKGAQEQVKTILETLKKDSVNDKLVKTGQLLMTDLKNWDEKMVQRKSKAYDDVENFENKFTAEYLFLINQVASDIPRVTKAALSRKMELDKQWQDLKTEGDLLKNDRMPAFNKLLWEEGIGAVHLD